jgi:hypothetical protein
MRAGGTGVAVGVDVGVAVGAGVFVETSEVGPLQAERTSAVNSSARKRIVFGFEGSIGGDYTRK